MGCFLSTYRLQANKYHTAICCGNHRPEPFGVSGHAPPPPGKTRGLVISISHSWSTLQHGGGNGRSRFESESGHEERTCHEQENVWGALLRLAAFLGRTPPHDREPYAACRHDGDGMRVPCPRVPTVCGTMEHSGGLLLLCPTDVRLHPTRVAIMLPAGGLFIPYFPPWPVGPSARWPWS